MRRRDIKPGIWVKYTYDNVVGEVIKIRDKAILYKCGEHIMWGCTCRDHIRQLKKLSPEEILKYKLESL